MNYLGGPLPGPLVKYERYIKDVIWELGVQGKEDEFIREGKVAVYRIQKEIESLKNEVIEEIYMCRGIRAHLIKLIVVKI